MRSTCCSAGKAKRLLVAGVDPSVTKPDLARRIPGSATMARLLRRPRQRIGRHPLQCGGSRPLARQAQLQLGAADHQRLAHAPRALRVRARCSAANIKLIPDAVRTEPSFLTLFGEYNKYLLRRAGGLGRPLMTAAAVAALRARSSIRDRALGARRASSRRLFGRRPTLAVVLSWAEFHHWLVEHVLGIRTCVSRARSRPVRI